MEILEILSTEKGLLYEMLNTLMAEKEVLINDNIEGIHRTTSSIEELKIRLSDIEKTRMTKLGSKRLKDILPELDENDRVTAEALGREMEDMVFKIQEINDTNKLLVKQSLNYVKSVINLVSPGKVTVYNPAGSVENTETGSIVLNKSV